MAGERLQAGRSGEERDGETGEVGQDQQTEREEQVWRTVEQAGVWPVWAGRPVWGMTGV